MQYPIGNTRLTLKDTVYAVCEPVTGHYIAGLTVGQPRAAESLADADLSFERSPLEILASRQLPNTPHEVVRLDRAAPAPSRCPHCGTTAAEVICHLCKTPRPFYARLIAAERGQQRGDAQLQFLVAILIFIGLATAAVLVDRSRAQALTQLELPAHLCPRPAPGQVLHITVIARESDGRVIASNCVTATTQPTRRNKA